MRSRQNPKGPPDPGYSQQPDKPHPDGNDTEPNPEDEGDIVRIHYEYVQRRLEGGAPATPQAYARAMAQWQQLPGAIASLSATDLTQAQEAPPNEGSTLASASDIEDAEQTS